MTRSQASTHVTPASDAVMHLEYVIDIPVWAHDATRVGRPGVEVRPVEPDRARRTLAVDDDATRPRRTRRRRPMRARVLRLIAALAGLLIVMAVVSHAHAQDAASSLEPGALRTRVAERAGPAIDACYTDARLRAPTTAGRVDIEFRLTADGRVDAARVVASTVAPPDATFEACVVDALEAVRFDDVWLATAVDVKLPMSFEPPRAKAGTVAAGATAQAMFRQRLREDEAVAACVQRARDRNGVDPTGELDTRVTLDSEGRVTRVELIDSTFQDTELELCVLDAMRDITVPAYKGGPPTRARVQFRFAR